MLISYEIIKKYVDLPKGVTAERVARDLTMATVEVESVSEKGSEFDKVVVGKIKKLEKHPNADKLTLAMVDVGEEREIKVVCGGNNLKKDQLIAFAKVGSMVRWHGEGDLVKLESAKIRGVESHGMICGANEIGLFGMFPHEEEEILDLTEFKFKVGEPVAKAVGLSGTIFDIDNKSLTNRPDLWGHYGIARELAAIYDTELKEMDTHSEAQLGQSGDFKVEIKDYDLCPRYLGCIVENIKVEESPKWLKKELMATDHSVINNIVDITNYVMEEVGQPLHAFDKAGIDKIIVRRAKKNEKLVLLDESEMELGDDMLVIADSKNPVALAGVMGGLKSGISDSTTSIILEAANFDAANNRQTSQKLNVRTDSSIRFEKALDPNTAELGMRRALAVIKEILPNAKISPIIIEDGNFKDKNISIKIEHKFLENRIGVALKKNEVIGILGRLGFGVGEKDGVYSVAVPSWRSTGDVSITEDIVEEVARIYGYDNLGERVELVDMEVAKYQEKYDIENKVKIYLSASAGMSEVFNYPWVAEGEIEIANPPAEDLNFLQTSLIPNITKNVIDNLRFTDNFKIFELARVYTKEKGKWDNKMVDLLPHQPKMLSGAVAGRESTLLEVKGIVEGMGLIFKDLNVYAGKDKIGFIKEVLNNKFKNKKVTVFEIDFEKYLQIKKKDVRYEKVSEYPGISRDIAVELDWNAKWGDIESELKKIDKLVYNIKFLSEYPLEDKKSLAFRVEYQANRTLTDKEVNKVHDKIIKLLEAKFKANLRK